MDVELLEAAQDALFTALKPLENVIGVPTGLQVFQHVPEDTQPPMVMIGHLSSDDAGEKGHLLEEITAEIQYVYRGPGRDQLLLMMREGRRLLRDQELASDVAAFETPRWVKSEAGDALADGVTYVGLQIFKFYAQPA